jgi:simple sugar transport system ATP-binding protein/ribose transport system ATP-binding protein
VDKPAHIETRDLSKRFGGVQALREVSVSIAPGSIHALVGENGAGKSTLGKIIAGVHTPDGGELLLEGREVHFGSPRAALAHGITTIAQEISLVPARTAVENVFLGIEDAHLRLVDRRRLSERYSELCDEVGFHIPERAVVSSLRLADQQKVEILRAVARKSRLIVMDESTAALQADESERLFGVVRSLRDRGTTIVYVSHFLEEVLDLADTVTVLRDGRVVQTTAAAEESPASLVRAMLGRSMDLAFPAKAAVDPDAPVVLSVDGLSTSGFLTDISLQIRAGEILGLAGLVGSGRSEVARAIFAADPRTGGVVKLNGERITLRSPKAAVGRGIALVPESRKTQGLLMGRSITENITLPHLEALSRGRLIVASRERQETQAMVARVDVRAPNVRTPVTALSGGNQQKVLFGKWLFRPPAVLIADEPTRGVDIGAKRAIYDLLQSLAASGMAILLISSEMEEVLGLAHRIMVMRKGRIVAELAGGALTEDAILAAAFAVDDTEEVA